MFRIHHKQETVSTNLDARSGRAWDVFTADFQSAGRGRLDHKWLAPPGANLAMSVVLPVGGLSPAFSEGLSPALSRGLSPALSRGLSPAELATLPLVVGLAVLRALENIINPAELPNSTVALKWPNDIYIGNRKVSGILCERHGDNVIAGIGINVKRRKFPKELQDKAISLGDCPQFSGDCPQFSGDCPQFSRDCPQVVEVRDAVLKRLAEYFLKFVAGGFAAVYSEIKGVDFLKGRELEVVQTDDDAEPVCGICGGIEPDGSLNVGGIRVYAGESRVRSSSL